MSDIDEQVEQLSESDCWLMLRTVQLGRLAVSTPTGPDIFPINFVVDHGSVVFRTASGTKLTAALAGHRLAFEADGVDVESRRLWSVVVHGVAAEITRTDDALDALTLPLTPAQAAPKPRFLRITPQSISGRRFEAVDPERWTTVITHSRRAPLE